MTAAELLVLLRDVVLVLELTPEGKLRYEALARDLTDAEVALIREHRDALIAHLRAEQAARQQDAAVADPTRWRIGGFGPRLIESGWNMPGPLDWCVACNGGTVWADSLGRPRHPWCAAPRRSA